MTAPDQLWESNIFGKSVFEMVNDGLTHQAAPDAR